MRKIFFLFPLACSLAISAHAQSFQTQVSGEESFVPLLHPCRALDTRSNETDAWAAGPSLLAGETRSVYFGAFAPNYQCNFTYPQNNQSIPLVAYSMHVTVLPLAGRPLGYLSVFPSGTMRPPTSVINSDGRVKSTAVIVPAGTDFFKSVSFYASDATDLIVDIDGLFIAGPPTNYAYGFVPTVPCTVSTLKENPGVNVVTLASNLSTSSNFNPCDLPASAAAFATNLTINAAPLSIPTGNYAAAWSITDGEVPKTSTLNQSYIPVSSTALLSGYQPSGIYAYYFDPSASVTLRTDVSGYFLANAGGSFRLLTPGCRAYDSRGEGGGPIVGFRQIGLSAGGCNLNDTLAFANAQGLILNITAIPSGKLTGISLFPGPVISPASTPSLLSSADGSIVSNLALVKTQGGNFALNVQGAPSDVIVDVVGVVTASVGVTTN